MTKQLAQFTTIDVALSVGGLDLRLQEAALRKNPDIVIATPGRFVSIHLNFLTWNAEILKINIEPNLPPVLPISILGCCTANESYKTSFTGNHCFIMFEGEYILDTIGQAEKVVGAQNLPVAQI